MQKIKLSAAKREVIGRKVKNFRKKGFIPANLYGKKIKSQSLTLEEKEFEKIFSQAGETGIVDLSVEGEKETHSVMIQNLQKHPVGGEILHVDLRQIILTEKVTADIPVELTGESEAATQKVGILIQNVSEIEVEALPLDLPEKFVVDVSKLANVGDQILVKEIEVDKSKVELKVEENLVVVKVEPLAKEEVTPPPAEAPIEGEEVPSEAGEKPTEEKASGEENPVEEKKEEKKE